MTAPTTRDIKRHTHGRSRAFCNDCAATKADVSLPPLRQRELNRRPKSPTIGSLVGLAPARVVPGFSQFARPDRLAQPPLFCALETDQGQDRVHGQPRPEIQPKIKTLLAVRPRCWCCMLFFLLSCLAFALSQHHIYFNGLPFTHTPNLIRNNGKRQMHHRPLRPTERQP